jgi:2-dehydropantoate 2-reductase
VNIVIAGGGVMGRLWATWLTVAGHDVTVVDADPGVVSELNQRGVWVEQRDHAVAHVCARANTDARGLPTADIVFFFVKSEQTANAAERVASVIGPATAVVTLQNGLGSAEALAARFPPRQIVYGPTEQGGSLSSDGRVVHAHDGDTFLGPYPDGSDTSLAVRVAAVLRDAGVPAIALPSVKVPVWQKRIFAAAVLPVAALTGLPAGDIYHPRVFAAVAALATEAVAEANAAGCGLELRGELDRIQARLRAAPQAKASMLQDIQAHRDTEIDAISGAIADAASTRGATALVCRAATALVHGREMAWRAEPARV